MYEKFQEWLNDCPVQIEDYQDHVDHISIRFDVSSDNNKEEESTSPVIITDDNYASKVDTLVESMGVNELTHDSEGC